MILYLVTMVASFCCMLCCLSDAENTSENKLRLPAPSAAVSKPYSNVPTKNTPKDDDVDYMASSLLAGMMLIYSDLYLFFCHVFQFYRTIKINTETKILISSLRPRPKFWPQGQVALNSMVSFFILECICNLQLNYLLNKGKFCHIEVCGFVAAFPIARVTRSENGETYVVMWLSSELDFCDLSNLIHCLLLLMLD